MELKVATVVEAVDGLMVGGNPDDLVISVCIDSRLAGPGSLFVAFSGQRTDGHLHLGDCRQRGAVAALVEKDLDPVPGMALVRVENTLIALQKLATYWRQRFELTVVGITGSSGKTTTKELVAAVLSTGFCTLKTLGNHNNEIGMPLRLFDLEVAHQAAVLEMGMDAQGEITRLCQVSQPNYGVITNVGDAHIEKLGSRENILRAKLELADNLASPGVLFVNGDDAYLLQGAQAMGLKLKTFGLGKENTYCAQNLFVREWGTEFEVTWLGQSCVLNLNMPGEHNVLNALAAFAVGIELGLSPETIGSGLKEARTEKGRLNLLSVAGMVLIDDSYNSNPSSAMAALDILASRPEKRKFAFLGSMLELGTVARERHRDLGRHAASLGLEGLIAVGNWSQDLAQGALAAGMNSSQVQVFADSAGARAALCLLKPGDAALFKGSRGVQMETLVNYLVDGGQQVE